MNTSKKVTKMVIAATFAAIIILMATVPFLGYIPLGVTRATIIHVPVIIGAIVLGPSYGAFLGFVFGLTSLAVNTFNPTITSFVFSPFYTLGDTGGNLWSLVICFVPRILIGVVSFYVYRLARKLCHSEAAALAAAGVAGSMTNTLLVMNLIYLLFGESYAAAKGISYEALYGVIMGVIGVNGVLEAIVAAVLSAAVGRVLIHFVKRAGIQNGGRGKL